MIWICKPPATLKPGAGAGVVEPGVDWACERAGEQAVCACDPVDAGVGVALEPVAPPQAIRAKSPIRG